MVGLERVARPVDPEAVGLHGQPPLRPAEVELPAVLIAVDLRARQLVVEAELEEERLEIAPRRGVVRAEVGEERRQRGRARSRAVRGQDPHHLPVVVELQLLGPLDRAAQLVRGHDRGEVEERAGDGRERQAVVLGDLPALEVDAVHAQVALATAAAPRRDRRLDERAAPRPQPPLARGAPMAQHRVVADVEQRGEDMALPPQLRVTQRVDPAPHGDQPPVPQPVVDPARAQPQREQLPPGDDPMLLLDHGLDGTETSHRNV